MPKPSRKKEKQKLQQLTTDIFTAKKVFTTINRGTDRSGPEYFG
jgi:hypothetical protein